MTTILTRSPLGPLSMNHAGTQKRRSARLSREGTEDQEPAPKRSKVDGDMALGSDPARALPAQTARTAQSKARKVYETEVDDFAFSRGSRRAKSKPSQTRQAPVADPERSTPVELGVTSAQPDNPPPKSTPKKPVGRAPTTPDRHQTGARRSKRLSDEREVTQQPQSSPHRPAHAQSHVNTDRRTNSPAKHQTLTIEKTRKRGPNGREEEETVMRINLPFHETPVNRKNKKMRKSGANGQRRTSTGMRGRRASSLIDEGRGNAASEATLWSPATFIESHSLEELCSNPMALPPSPSTAVEFLSRRARSPRLRNCSANKPTHRAAVPHNEVLAEEFYKHISADLTEPRRMRLLLGWCGDRALPERPSDDAPEDTETRARRAAHIVQSKLCKELMSKAELSHWYSRDESATVRLEPLRKKPNPRNIVNTAKALELEAEISRLQQQQTEWEQLLQSVPTPDSQHSADDATGHRELSPLHPELLDSPQRALVDRLHTGADAIEPHALQDRLRSIAANLEFAVDSFANGVHTLSTTKTVADRIANRTLAEAATLLEERAKARETSVDGFGALKALGKILNGSRLPR